MPATCAQVRRGGANKVRSFMDLATEVAELQFMNRGFVLLFRGQTGDYKNLSRNTSLKPSLFRAAQGNPGAGVLQQRFDRLREAEERLKRAYVQAELLGRDRIMRQQILRWAILQHYEVCPTPLLDVTHSLRIAASFASDGATREAYIFVLGVPNLSGAVTASAEAGIQIVRLSSVCPPSTLRPHIQEGYLLGTYPDMVSYAQKQNFAHYEIDFGRRLVAKFRFNPQRFWRSDHFPRVDRAALYPDRDDPLFRLTRDVARRLPPLR